MKRTTIIISAVLLIVSAFCVHGAFASTTNGTIPVASYAWGENFGWINFGCANCGVSVTDSAITGNAWSAQYGWINLSPTNGGVTNDGNGNLGGNAWSSGLGWISFSGVAINSSGRFTGVAGTQGTTAGRINFGCANCNVTTDWRPASVRNGNSNNNSGNNSGNSSSGSGSSVSSSGGFLPGFFNLFNNNPFGNTGVTVNNANSVNPETVEANGGQGLNPSGGGALPGSSFATGTSATSTRYSSVTARTHQSNQPTANVGSNRFGVFSPLFIGIASVVLLLVILILRFLL